MSHVPPPPAPDAVLDTECYVNFWLCLTDDGLDVEIWNDRFYVNEQEVDHLTFRNTLHSGLQRRTLITFNGNNYDMPLVTLAVEGASAGELKAASDAIIVRGMKPWEIARVPDWIDHIDLFDVAPGQGSLKAYAAKMHMPRLQDLPIDPSAYIDADARAKLREYCRLGDLPATRALFKTFTTQLDLRRDMGREYGVDVRSKSDAQIAEAVMKRILGFKVERASVPYGSKFHYRPPEWLSFQTLDVLDLLARSPFTIGDNGSPVMTDELAGTRIRIGGSSYQMGSGGLHSTESETTHFPDDRYVISDHDVASYYPSLILRTGIAPRQIGPIFQQIYRDWYVRRLAAKDAGDKKNANSLKTLLNGTFGKLGSPWSIFYAPSEMIQVTITGQLALLMLIERLEAAGISVISANTDGIVVKCPIEKLQVRDAVIALWEHVTDLKTEANVYRMLASRDVNSYVAIKPDGEVKTKGAYSPPEPGASGWPNPTTQVSIDAAVAYLRDGTPIAETVHACTDIRQFLSVRKVTGGGSYCPSGMLPKKTTQKAMRELCGDLAKEHLFAVYDYMIACEVARRAYLGKIVRWYYAKDSRGCIVTSKGGHVARTEGSRPLMQLTGEFPNDVDHDWYIREAWSLLQDMGAVERPNKVVDESVISG